MSSVVLPSLKSYRYGNGSVADPGCFIPDPDPTIAPSRIRIPDPGGKQAPDPGSRIRVLKKYQIPDPGSGSATLDNGSGIYAILYLECSGKDVNGLLYVRRSPVSSPGCAWSSSTGWPTCPALATRLTTLYYTSTYRCPIPYRYYPVYCTVRYRYRYSVPKSVERTKAKLQTQV
jgi:hypothetical protein